MEGTTRWKDRTLYYRGDPGLLGRRSAAVVGTRHPQEKGRTGGYRMTEKMCGITDLVIVTGLAIGCDTIAVRAALDSGTPVIAVLPSGTSNICPRSNRALAEEIVEKVHRQGQADGGDRGRGHSHRVRGEQRDHAHGKGGARAWEKARVPAAVRYRFRRI